MLNEMDGRASTKRTGTGRLDKRQATDTNIWMDEYEWIRYYYARTNAFRHVFLCPTLLHFMEIIVHMYVRQRNIRHIPDREPARISQ